MSTGSGGHAHMEAGSRGPSQPSSLWPGRTCNDLIPLRPSSSGLCHTGTHAKPCACNLTRRHLIPSKPLPCPHCDRHQKYPPTTRSPLLTPIFLIAAAYKATCRRSSSKLTFTISSLPSPGKRKRTGHPRTILKTEVLSHRHG